MTTSCPYVCAQFGHGAWGQLYQMLLCETHAKWSNVKKSLAFMLLFAVIELSLSHLHIREEVEND